jgi:hypothetical protein
VVNSRIAGYWKLEFEPLYARVREGCTFGILDELWPFIVAAASRPESLRRLKSWITRAT